MAYCVLPILHRLTDSLVLSLLVPGCDDDDGLYDDMTRYRALSRALSIARSNLTSHLLRATNATAHRNGVLQSGEFQNGQGVTP